MPFTFTSSAGQAGHGRLAMVFVSTVQVQAGQVQAVQVQAVQNQANGK